MAPTNSAYGSNGSDQASIAIQNAQGSLKQIHGGTQKSAADLREQLSRLKEEINSLSERSTGMSDTELERAHRELLSKFSSVRYAARGIASQASRQINRGMETTTGYVKDKPMQSVGVAVGIGVLLGMLFKRR